MNETKRRSRREFLKEGAAFGVALGIRPALEPYRRAWGTPQGAPSVIFPPRLHDRIAVSSYPFRSVVIGRNGENRSGMALAEFGAHVVEKFGVDRVEPWSEHFLSLEPAYLTTVRTKFKEAGVSIANIAVDGQHSPYAKDPAEREKAVKFSKSWIEAAARLGSVNVRTNIPQAKGEPEDLERLAESLRQVSDYGASQGVVVHLENDNPQTEDPFFLVKVINQVNSPWLRTLPDFCNTLAAHPQEYAYKGITQMFAHAFGICHVKAMELDAKKQLRKVDFEKTFGILKASGYRGYLSMEFDSPGDPYEGTRELILATEKYLSKSREGQQAPGKAKRTL
jgi:sugar phosphate isomerase/epimerase